MCFTFLLETAWQGLPGSHNRCRRDSASAGVSPEGRRGGAVHRPHRLVTSQYAGALVLALVGLLAGCGAQGHKRSGGAYLEQAQRAGFAQHVWKEQGFAFLTLTRDLDRAGDPVVFIEGDGMAWRTRWHPSSDPTPKTPVALQLALKTTDRPVIYMARPCQFLSSEHLRNCDARYWTSHRFSSEVISAADVALRRLTLDGRLEGIIGYSGGAALAALLADSKLKPRWLITLAGNLDHVRWTGHHGVTPLSGSLNPAEMMGSMAMPPQLHLVGVRDERVPPAVTESYLAQLPQNGVAMLRRLDGYDHDCCWVRDWPQPLCEGTTDSMPWFPTFCQP